jgi:hypothetical protein
MEGMRAMGSFVAETRTYAAVMLVCGLALLGVGLAADVGATLLGTGVGVLAIGVLEGGSWRRTCARSIERVAPLPADVHVEDPRHTVIRATLRAGLMYGTLAAVILGAALGAGVLPYAGVGAGAGTCFAGCIAYAAVGVMIRKGELARDEAIVRETRLWAWRETGDRTGWKGRSSRSWSLFIAGREGKTPGVR